MKESKATRGYQDNEVYEEMFEDEEVPQTGFYDDSGFSVNDMEKIRSQRKNRPKKTKTQDSTSEFTMRELTQSKFRFIMKPRRDNFILTHEPDESPYWDNVFQVELEVSAEERVCPIC